MDDDWEKLVGGIPTPLKKMTSSVGMMTFPIHGKNVPNHTPVFMVNSYQFNHSKLSNRDAGWIRNEAQSERTLT